MRAATRRPLGLMPFGRNAEGEFVHQLSVELVRHLEQYLSGTSGGL
jgi:hypothetical protein